MAKPGAAGLPRRTLAADALIASCYLARLAKMAQRSSRSPDVGGSRRSGLLRCRRGQLKDICAHDDLVDKSPPKHEGVLPASAWGVGNDASGVGRPL
jgi:hypothetical protein